MTGLDDDAIDRALHVWREEGDVPYMARTTDYLFPQETVDHAALAVADENAERLNRDLMRRAIEAALSE